MKKLFLSIACLFLFAMHLKAQETPYQKAMKKEIAKVLETDSLQVLQQSANAFARIVEMNSKEWQPYYYQSLAFTFQGLNKALSPEKKDLVLDQAEEIARKAEAISGNNVEIVVLQGFITMAKLSVDPASRGQSLSGQVLQTFGKALSIDSKNPRAQVLMAQMELGMSQFFGSGNEKACGLARQSLASYQAQNEEALKAALMPYWGKKLAENMAESCK